MSETLSHYGHAPVLVLPSPPLEQLMAKNHLTFTELLKPFGQPPLLSSAMHFRTPSRSQYQLKRWGVRFVSAHEMEPMHPVLAERWLDAVLASPQSVPRPRLSGDGIRSVDDVAPTLKALVEPVPWYSRYRADMIGSLRFSDGELLDQPLGLMIAVSSTEGAAGMQWVELSRSHGRVLPPAMQRGVYDTAIARCIVIVHDKHSEVADSQARNKAVELLKALQRQYGSEVLGVVLELNSMPIEIPNPSQRDLWSSFVLQGRIMRQWQQRRGEVEAILMAGSKQAAAAAAAAGGADGQSAAAAAQGVNGDGTVLNMAGDDSFNTYTDDTFHLLPVSIVDISSSPADWKAVEPTSPSSPPSSGFQSFLSSLLSTPPEQARGQYLSPFDIDNLTTFIHTFLSQHLLPATEQRFLALTTAVNAVRGSFNRLKAGWKSMMGGGGQGKGWSVQLNTYALGSIESQARMLADLSYAVQDWESAELCYGYVLRDYRNDVKQYRNYQHLASANEMMALTLTHLDPNRYHDNIREHLLSARTTFFSIGDHRRAARVGVLATEAYRIKQPTLERWKEGIYITIKAAKKDFTSAVQHRTVRAALQMEYVAYLFLMPPAPTVPLIRKYALSLLLAGRMYRHFGFSALEVRCDQSAAALYADKSWRHIDDSVYDRLGRELYALHQYQQSVHFFVQLIARPRNIDSLTARPINPLAPRPSREAQERFLSDLVFVVQRWYGVVGQGKEVPGLRLPTFVDDSVQVVTNDDNTVPSCYAQQAWNQAARTQRMVLNAELNNKPLFTPSMMLYRESDRGCVVHGPLPRHQRITVSVRVLNPLQVELEVKNLRLRARHTSASAGITVSEGHVDSSPLPACLASSLASSSVLYPSSTPFVVNTQDVTLPAGEATVLSLTLMPMQEGSLLIEGVQWELLSLHGYHAFSLPARSVSAPGKRGQPQLQPDPSLSIPIHPPGPLLAIALDGLPSHLLHGEYRQATLALTNIGAVGMDRLTARISHPGFIILGLCSSQPEQHSNAAPSSVSPAVPLPSSISTPSLSSHRTGISSRHCYPYDWSDVSINLSVTLHPGQSLHFPVWLRGATEGQHNISFLIRYDAMSSAAASSSSSRQHRLCYLERQLRVRPLLGVRLFNKPSFADVKDSLLGIDVVDRQTEGWEGTEAAEADAEVQVKVEAVNVLSKAWIIAPVGQHPDTSAAGRQASRSLSQQDLQAGHLASSSSVTSSSHSASPLQSLHVCACESVLAAREALLLFFRITNLPSLSLPSPAQQALCPTHQSTVFITAAGSGTAPPSSSLAVDCSRPPHSNLLGMEKALMIEEERQALIINPAATIADTGAANKLDLIITWSILPNTAASTASSPSTPRYGFYHQPGVGIMKVLPSACPLKVHLEYPPVVRVPAAAAASPSASSSPSSSSSPSGFPLSFPVHVTIRNILEDSPISFLFETLPPDEEFDPQRRAFKQITSSSLSSRYQWRGKTRTRVTGLRGGEETEVQLAVDVVSEGEYNLNRFRFTVEVGGGKKPRVFFFPLQHLVSIERQTPEGGLRSSQGQAAAAGQNGSSDAVTVKRLRDGELQLAAGGGGVAAAGTEGDTAYEQMEEAAE